MSRPEHTLPCVTDSRPWLTFPSFFELGGHRLLLWGFPLHACSVAKSCPPLLQPHGLQPARFLCPWDFPGKNTGVGGRALLQGIFPTQESNPQPSSNMSSLPQSQSQFPNQWGAPCFSPVFWSDSRGEFPPTGVAVLTLQTESLGPEK